MNKEAAIMTSRSVVGEAAVSNPAWTGSEVAPFEWISEIQQLWAQRTVDQRVAVLRGCRHALARQTEAIVAAVAAHTVRTAADVMVSEILPLLAACRFLEKNARLILAPRKLGKFGLPFWLQGVQSEVHRVPLGKVLVIGPSNYPLFLPGVQVLQALVAGNSVTWKPGRDGRAVAILVAKILTDMGLPRSLLRVTEETPEAGEVTLSEGADKVFFTGSAEVGHKVMRRLATTGTPSVMELSGCSSVLVMSSAELDRVVAAVSFGIRLNGAATCMAPRRVIVIGCTAQRRDLLVAQLESHLAQIRPVLLAPEVQAVLADLVKDARAQGAQVYGEVAVRPGEAQRPIVLVRVTPEMRIAQSDIFAPVLSVIDVVSCDAAVSAELACPYSLTVSIFGEEAAARRLATKLIVGTVLVNDVIVSTTDPRVPFGGRKASGFGVTRGAEGLLEMTAVKTVLVRTSFNRRHYQTTCPEHARLFGGLIVAAYGATWRERWRGLSKMVDAARKVNVLSKRESGRQSTTWKTDD